MRRFGILLSLFTALGATSVHAGPNDLDISSLMDSANQPDNAGFIGLAKELSSVITDINLAPAETPGLSGFDFGIDYSFHDITESETFWKNSLQGRFENRTPPLGLQTLGVKARKGFILPIPHATELELGASWIGDSNMWSLGAAFRLGLYEMGSFNTKYWMTWVPDVAAMIGGNRLIGTSQMDLTSANAGLAVSKNFAIAGDFSLTPFFSYQQIYTHAASDTIDPDPSDFTDVDRNVVFNALNEFTFDNAGYATRQTGGFRLVVGLVELVLGYASTTYTINNAERTMSHYNVRGGLNF
ncbi:MAG: hypothetical protein CMH56_09335 [Myxococcales bacterium]|nr:hypothetical protein [Myxococcales bacterium]